MSVDTTREAKARIVQIPIALTVFVRPEPSALTMMIAGNMYGERQRDVDDCGVDPAVQLGY